MRRKTACSWLLVSALVSTMMVRSAEARVDLLMIHPPDAVYTVAPGGNVTFTVYLTVSDVVNPCADLYAYAYPETGGILWAPAVAVRANGNYRSDVVYIAPNQAGRYLVDVRAIIERCDGEITADQWWNDLTVNVVGGDGGGGNPDGDITVESHSFGDPVFVDEEASGEICLHNQGNDTYDIDRIDLDGVGVGIEWGEDDWRDDDGRRLTPDDTDCYGGFRFTPRGVGILTIDVDVRTVDGDWHNGVDWFEIEIVRRFNNCVRTECWGDERWCVNSNNQYDHLVQDCGDDSQGVCGQNRCDGDRVVCTRPDTDRYCANDQCQSQIVNTTVVVDACVQNEVCRNASCVDDSCVRTECRNDDRWCVDVDGNYSRKQQECGDDEVGQCRNTRCNNDGDVICDRTDVDHFCLEDRCRQQSIARTVVADDCNAVLEECQNGACANRCLLGCFDQCNGDELAVRVCEDNICQVQSRDDCNMLDSQGPVVRYCSGNAVHGRQQVTDGYCGGVLNACRTSTSTEQLGVLDACADYCDGNISHTNRGCNGGACSVGVSTNCAFGCNQQTGQCTPDPCANVRCNAYCDSNTRYSNGRCGNGRCLYDIENCDAYDGNVGGREQYCSPDNNAVWSHQPYEDYSCGGGECVGQSTFVDWREELVCADYCDGNTRVWSRSCDDGACTNGERTNCDDHDSTSDVRNVCFENDQVDRVWFVDFSCRNATCDPAEGEWVIVGGVSCRWGCNDDTGLCNQDPCRNVVCENRCSVDAVMAGHCSDGRCFYDQVEDCNDRDVVHGEREFYCADAERVRSRQAMDDYFCAVGECVGRSMWAGDRPEERCTDYCDDAMSFWGRACQDGACTLGDRSDCDAMDTEPRSVHICDGDEVHAFDAWRDFACDPATGRCDAGSDQTGPIRPFEDCAAREGIQEIVDEYCVGNAPAQLHEISSFGCVEADCAVVDVTEREDVGAICAEGTLCEDGACEACEADWNCGRWSNDCTGDLTRTRVCVDRNGCFHDRVENEECPCEITGGWWSWNADGNGAISDDERVEDGDSVYLAVEHRGRCANLWYQFEIRIVQGIPDQWENFRILPDIYVGTDVFQIPDNFSPATLQWLAAYSPSDTFGANHYYFYFPRFDERSDVIVVHPSARDVERIDRFLIDHAPDAYRVEDQACYHYHDVTITDRCVELWEQAGVIAEVESEEALVSLLHTIFGETLPWVAYTLGCVLCEIGTGLTTAICVIPDGGEIVECGAATSLARACGIPCLEWLGRALATVGRTLWRFVTDTVAVFAADRVAARGFREVSQELRDDMSLRLLENGAGDTYDVAVWPDPDAADVVKKRVFRNLLSRHGLGPLLRYNNEEALRVLFTASGELTAGELAVIKNAIEEEDFLGALDTAYRELSEGRYRLTELVNEFHLGTIINDDPYTFGLTVPENGRSTVTVATRSIMATFGDDAGRMLVGYVTIHEAEHTIWFAYLDEFGYRLRPNDEVVVPALEYLTDIAVLRRPIAFRDSFKRLVQVALREEERLTADEALARFLTAARRNLDVVDDAMYEFVALRAKAHTFEAREVEASLTRKFDRATARLNRETLNRIRQMLDRLTDELVADGELFARQRRGEALDLDLLDILCRKYRELICPGEIRDPNVAGDPGEPTDPRELGERDAGTEGADDPRQLAERDAGGVAHGDVLTIGGQDGAEDVPDSGLCMAHQQLRGYIFDSAEQCFDMLGGDPREQYCHQLKPTTCWSEREGGCACSIGWGSSSNSSFLLLAFVAFLTRLSR